MVSTVDPRAWNLAGAAFPRREPWSAGCTTGGGLLAAGFPALAFAVASLLFLWTLLTVAFADGFFGSADRGGRARAFGCGDRRAIAAPARRRVAAGIRAVPDQRGRACGAAGLLPRGLRRALGGVVLSAPDDRRFARRGPRHGGGCCAQRDAVAALRPFHPEAARRGYEIRLRDLGRADGAFWGWYFLSLNDMNFGYGDAVAAGQRPRVPAIRRTCSASIPRSSRR